jgi:hypothetical protein
MYDTAMMVIPLKAPAEGPVTRAAAACAEVAEALDGPFQARSRQECEYLSAKMCSSRAVKVRGCLGPQICQRPLTSLFSLGSQNGVIDFLPSQPDIRKPEHRREIVEFIYQLGNDAGLDGTSMCLGRSPHLHGRRRPSLTLLPCIQPPSTLTDTFPNAKCPGAMC